MYGLYQDEEAATACCCCGLVVGVFSLCVTGAIIGALIVSLIR